MAAPRADLNSIILSTQDSKVAVQAIQSGKYDVNAIQPDTTFNPLYHALHKTNKDPKWISVVEALLEAKADSSYRYEFSYSVETALHEIIKMRYTDHSIMPQLIQLFLNHGADTELTNSDGLTPLQLLCDQPIGFFNQKALEDFLSTKQHSEESKEAESAFGFMSQEPLKVKINAQCENADSEHHQKTALHFAAANGHAQAVRALCAVGADTEIKDADGNTPIINAIKSSSAHISYVTAVVNALLEFNAKTDYYHGNKRKHALFAALDVHDNGKLFNLLAKTLHLGSKTILHLAAEGGNVFSKILKKIDPRQRKDLLAAQDERGNTPLHTYLMTLYTLINTPASIDSFITMLPRVMSGIKQLNKILKAYEKEGVSLDIQNHDGLSPLHFAIMHFNDQYKVIPEALILHGADMYAPISRTVLPKPEAKVALVEQKETKQTAEDVQITKLPVPVYDEVKAETKSTAEAIVPLCSYSAPLNIVLEDDTLSALEHARLRERNGFCTFLEEQLNHPTHALNIERQKVVEKRTMEIILLGTEGHQSAKDSAKRNPLSPLSCVDATDPIKNCLFSLFSPTARSKEKERLEEAVTRETRHAALEEAGYDELRSRASPSKSQQRVGS